MIAPSARNTAVLAAAIITGAAASAFGQQQVANLDEQQRLKAHLRTECPLGGDACEIPAARRFYEALTAERLKEAAGHKAAREAAEKRIADHQKAGEAAVTRAQCLSAISDAILGKRITPADVRSAKTTPTPTDDPCVWRSRLQPRIGELTKQ